MWFSTEESVSSFLSPPGCARTVRGVLCAMSCGNPVWRFLRLVYCDWTEVGQEHPMKLKVAAFICRPILNIVGSVLTLFVLWLILFRPYLVRPRVDAAKLTASESSGGGHALRYDLDLNVTFFNDHLIYAVRFDHLTAWLYYGGTDLGPSDDTLPTFALRPRRRRTVHAVLVGRSVEVGAAVAEQFSGELAQGRLNLDVRVKTTLTYKFWPNRADYYHEYTCRLQFPASDSNGTSAITHGVVCTVTK